MILGVFDPEHLNGRGPVRLDFPDLDTTLWEGFPIFLVPNQRPRASHIGMGKIMNDPPSESVHLLERLRAGDRRALADLFQRHRDRLKRMVEIRMDARLHGRIDASGVLQDGFRPVAILGDGGEYGI